MKEWLIVVGLMALCVVMVMLYACLVVASEADDEAERMREQTERKDCKLELFDDDGNYIEPQTEQTDWRKGKCPFDDPIPCEWGCVMGKTDCPWK